MDKATKTWLIVAACLVLVGCMIFGGVMTMLHWDFTKLSTVKYETNDHEIEEGYHNISIETKTADIVFVPAEGAKTSVICHEQKNMRHLVAVQDGTLVIRIVDSRKWYEHIGIDFRTPKITVYLPRGEFGALLVKSNTGDVKIPEEYKFDSIDITESTGDVALCASASEFVKIKTSTGDIRVEQVSTGTLDLSVSTGAVAVSAVTCGGDVKIHVSTGKTNLTDTRCKNLISEGDTGDISLTNVTAADRISIERNTGDVRFDGCDATEIFVETDTGDVTGTLLSEKVFLAQTDTGRVDVPKTLTGGRCEITTDTGDIRIDIQQ